MIKNFNKYCFDNKEGADSIDDIKGTGFKHA